MPLVNVAKVLPGRRRGSATVFHRVPDLILAPGMKATGSKAGMSAHRCSSG